MLVKIVTLFLIGMAILAAFGRLRIRRTRAKSEPLRRPGKCRSCGAPVIGKGPCACGAVGPGS